MAPHRLQMKTATLILHSAIFDLAKSDMKPINVSADRSEGGTVVELLLKCGADVNHQSKVNARLSVLLRRIMR